MVMLVTTMPVLTSRGQEEPPAINPGARHRFVESREDEPDVMFVHRNGEVLRIRRIGDDPEGRVRLQGPPEIIVKWNAPVMPGSESWPAGLAVITTNYVADGLTRIETTGDTSSAIALLNADSTVNFAYAVEFSAPLFSRIIPTDRIIVNVTNISVISAVTSTFPLDLVAPLEASTTEYVLRLRNPKTATAAQMVQTLQTSGLVVWAERDCLRDAQFHYTPTDPRFVNQWHLNAVSQNIGGVTAPYRIDLNATSAWDSTRGSPDVAVAVIDSAFDLAHSDLATNFTTTGAYDFYSNDADPSPDDPNLDQHGTAVAGLIGAVEGNSNGVVGVAHQSPMVPIKIAGSGNFPYDSDVANSVRHAAQYADIINGSWGYLEPALVVRSAVQYALQEGAGGRGAIPFYSSGNEAGYEMGVLTFSSSNNYQVRFRYVKDGSISAGLDQCFVDTLFLPNLTTEFFDGVTVPNLPPGYASSGGAWTSMVEFLGMRPESGAQFIGSPDITDSQSTYVQFTVNSPAPGSALYYRMRVDAQPVIYSNTTATLYDFAQVEYRVAGSGPWITNNYMGQPANVIASPAGFPETIAVGACDTTGRRSHYSSWGPELDFVAPSEGSMLLLGIETTDITGTNGYDAGDYCQNPYYGSQFSGTSASCPQAAGVGALVRSINTNLSPAQVRNIMRAAARKLDPGWYSYAGRMNGRNDFVGWGLLDAAAAVTLAQSTPSIKVQARQLKITEVSPVDGNCPFVELYNSSPAIPFPLENMMLTDGETGGFITGASFRFPTNTVIAPRGTVVVCFGAATTSLIARLERLLSTGGATPGGLQLYECTESGLGFNSMPVANLQPLSVASGLSAGGSNNIALVFTPGYAFSFLSDVIDGMAYGFPLVPPGAVIGAGPGLPAIGIGATGATATASYQRNGINDTENAMADFSVAASTPGRIVFGNPVINFFATPLTSTENELGWGPPPGGMVLVAASADADFDEPVHGAMYGAGMALGADIIVYSGSGTSAVHVVGTPDSLRYYAAWSIDPVTTNYSAAVFSSATTLASPRPLPFVEQADGGDFNPTSWPFVSGAVIDPVSVTNAPSAPGVIRLGSATSQVLIASTVIDAASSLQVRLRYRFMQGGGGDMPEAGDNLRLDYLSSARQWQPLTGNAAGGPGIGYFGTNSVTINPGYLHNQFRIRLSVTGSRADETDADNWLVDDLVLEAVADSDDDGMHDAWEQMWFGNLITASNHPAGDQDGDGFSDPEEFFADTNPTDSESKFPPAIMTGNAPASLSMVINPTSTARVYRIFSMTNLLESPQTWMVGDLMQTGNGGSVSFPVTNSGPVIFYRTGAGLR